MHRILPINRHDFGADLGNFTELTNWDDPELDFAKYTETGVIGDPTYGSAELGEKLWHDLLEQVAKTLKEIADD